MANNLTVRELEEKVLQGGMVTPAEMAAAQAAEDAARRIAELQEQREASELRERRKAEFEKLHRELKSDISAYAEASPIERTLSEIGNLILTFEAQVSERRESIAKFYERGSSLMSLYPEFPAGIGRDADGGIVIDGQTLRHYFDWKTTLANHISDVVAKASVNQQRRADGLPVEGGDHE